jgi:predicted outer membrane repeat protein
MNSSLRINWLIGATLLIVCSSTHATTFSIANGDVTSLKSAITTSNTNNLDDVIDLATNGTYVLTVRDNGLNGLPAIAPDSGHKLTINGHGATIMRSTVGGTPTFRFFYVNSGANLTVDGLVLSNGSPGAAHGGAIYNDGETDNVSLTIKNSTITGCSGDYGGAIFNDGFQDPSFPAHRATLTVSNSTISGNTGTQYGGGIWNESGIILMNVSYCTFSQNSASARSAGAIQFDGSSGIAAGIITSCTFTGNSAANYGGAVNIDGSSSGSATLTISDCTFDQNTANWGGGVAMDGSSGSAVVTVSNCTFNRDLSSTLGDAIYVSQTAGGTTSLLIGNTILASADPDSNLSIDNFSGGTASVTSQGHNLSDDAAGGDATTGPGGFLNHSGDIRNTDPLLDPAGLLNNGGPTQTIALQANSPAVNHGDNAIAPERDQRGYLPTNTRDIGAFELGALLAPIAAGSNKAQGSGAFAVSFPLTGAHGVECRSGGASGIYQLAMSFATPVTIASAAVQSGVGSVNTFTVTGSQATVNLTGVANAQHLLVRLTNVNDGVHTNNVDIPMDILIGDTNADHFVDAVDVSQTKSKSGQAVDATNFREDVNIDGFLDAVDTALVKSKSGTALPVALVSPLEQPARHPRGAVRDNEVFSR